MIRFIVGVAFISFFTVVIVSDAFAENKTQKYDAVIISADGSSVDCQNFSFPASFSIKVNGVKTDIESKQFKKIIVINRGYWNDGKSSHFAKNISLTLKDGRSFEVEVLWEAPALQALGCNIVDPISSKLVKNRIYVSEPGTVIDFSEEFGSLRKDSKGNPFPSHYLFSPFTGERLVLQ